MTVPFPSRGLLGYAGSVLAGGVSAGLFAVALTYPGSMLVLLAYFSAAPLFIAGLGVGVAGGAVASIAATIVLAFIMSLNFAAFYGVLFALPITILVMLALRRTAGANGNTVWYAEGDLLTATAIYPCLVFAAALLAAAGHDGGLLALTKETMGLAVTQFKGQLDADTYANFAAAMDQLGRVLPMVIGCSWMIVMLLSLFIAQITLKQQGWNLRPDFAIEKVAVPKWLIFAVAVAGLAGAFAPEPYNYIGTNLSIVLGVPFFIVGVGVVHAWAAATKYRPWILVLFYVLLGFPWPPTAVPAFLVTLLLGIVDQWIDFRRRIASRQKQGG